ncbi:isoprenylcysteine carboxylmethyltransferase family protein [bacterium]|nr:isoprenylcysteine carboxylmethyltransferase family protein [bacterium]
MLKLGEIFFKLRDYTPIPFVIVVIIYSSVNLQSLVVGILLTVFGETIRMLGVAHIGGVSRTRTYSTGQKLITNGLFGHVRNPLYIGNFFLSLGIVVASNVNIYFSILFVAFFFLQYFLIVNWEENNLLNTFGKEFEEYKSKVPRWIPSIFKKTNSDAKTTPDFKKAFKSERSTLLAVIVLYLIVLWRSHWLDGLLNMIVNIMS